MTEISARRPGPSATSAPPGRASGGDSILLYDGVCAFCNGTVRFILRHDRTGTMRFAPLGGATGQAVLARHPEARDVDSLVLVLAPDTAQESVVIRTDALLEIARYLRGPWRAATVARVVPRPLRDWAYGRFARVRYRLFGRLESCPLPSPSERARFLS